MVKQLKYYCIHLVLYCLEAYYLALKFFCMQHSFLLLPETNRCPSGLGSVNAWEKNFAKMWWSWIVLFLTNLYNPTWRYILTGSKHFWPTPDQINTQDQKLLLMWNICWRQNKGEKKGSQCFLYKCQHHMPSDQLRGGEKHVGCKFQILFSKDIHLITLLCHLHTAGSALGASKLLSLW